MTRGTHGTFIDHLTCVHFKHQLYGDTWQLKPTYFKILKILINKI
jgi:hypothetical protein